MSITIVDVKGFKASGKPFAMLTAYDYLMARALDEAGVPLLLVGDTLGIVVLGYSTTIPVTLDDVIHLGRTKHQSTTASGTRAA